MSEHAIRAFELGRQSYAPYKVCGMTLRTLRQSKRALRTPEGREAFRIGWNAAALG